MSRVFIAWSKLSRRTRELSKVVGAKLLFIRDKPPYLKAWLLTKKALRRLKPKDILVQLPQGPLLYQVVKLKESLGFRVIADVHTGFFVYDSLKGLLLNASFVRYLKRADIVIVHNEALAAALTPLRLSNRLLVVYDPLPSLKLVKRPSLGLQPGGYVVVPASWASDEPLYGLALAYSYSSLSRNYPLVVTGDYLRRPRLARSLLKLANGRFKLILTGYLPSPEYNWLVTNSAAVLTGTTREYTMLAAVWEAVAAKKPFIVSKTRTLQLVIGKSYPCMIDLSNPMEAGEVISACVERENWSGVLKAINRLAYMSMKSLKNLLAKLEGLEAL